MSRSDQVDENRPAGWLTSPPLGAYVHIPFCTHRCHYCDFNTYESLDEIHLPYARALIRSIEDSSRSWERAPWQAMDDRAVPEGPAATLFFGGGTPTLLPPEVLGEVIEAVRRTVGLTPDAEITVEANPETLDARTLQGLLEAGFTRISIGIQSTAKDVLLGLGRQHSARRALDAVAGARAAGFTSINADLIYGSTWESSEDWAHSLADVIEAGPDHVSAYALTVESDTPLHRSIAAGKVPDVDPDVQADRWELANEVLAAAGYARYEVSNWARPGHACTHNLIYWSAGDYVAFGAGAHGHHDGLRWWVERLPRDLIAASERGDPGVAGWELLDRAERGREALMLGLRLASGIDTDAFEERFGPEHLEAASPGLLRMAELGLLLWSDNRLRVAGGAALLGDDLLSRLP